MDEENKKVIDMSDCDDETFEQWTRGINRWRECHEPYILSSKSDYVHGMHDAQNKGFGQGMIMFGLIGAFSGLIGLICNKLGNK